MRDKIGLLVQLQECDNKIDYILKRKAEGPLRIEKLKQELEAFKERSREDEVRLDSLKKERRSLEQEVQDFENKITKSNMKLSNIKSNKEYQAALSEIEELKKKKFETEDKVLQLMESMEEAEKACSMHREKEKELEKEFQSKKLEIEKELLKLEERLKETEAERERVSSLIDGELLARYSFLKERKNGQAISAVREGVCQACHMNIPPQKYNELIRGTSLLTCPNCSRMIYWQEQASAQEAQI